MYKKAGIVVAILLIVIAIAIYFIASAAMNSDKEPDLDHVTSQTSSTQATPTATNKPVVAPPATQSTTQAQPVESQPTQTQPVVTQPTQTQPIDGTQTPPVESQSTTAYTEPVQTPPVEPAQGTVVLTEVSRLTNEYTDNEDIGTVVGRKMYVQNNQVVFSILINTTTHGQIEYYGDLYDYNIADGTRVTCQLRTYLTASSSFVAVISIST